MCDRKSEGIEAHSQHHVIRGIIAVALAAALKKLDHSLPAEHHAAATHKETDIRNVLKRHITRSIKLRRKKDQFRHKC